MGKIFKIFICGLFLLTLCSCSDYERDPNYVTPEEPHLYWKTITAVVKENNTKHWFASTHWYEVETKVYSEEYNLETVLYAKGSGAFGCPWEFNLQKGDMVEVQMNSWVYDSTGEVVRREISKIERKID